MLRFFRHFQCDFLPNFNFVTQVNRMYRASNSICYDHWLPVTCTVCVNVLFGFFYSAYFENMPKRLVNLIGKSR